MKSKKLKKKSNQINNEPHIEFITDRRIKLIKKFEVEFQDGKDHHYFTIPKGFVSDGASIPKIFWSLGFTPFQGKTLPASLVHDYFYKNHIPDRKFADYCFYHLLKKYKVNFVKRFIYWFFVRLFGKYK